MRHRGGGCMDGLKSPTVDGGVDEALMVDRGVMRFRNTT